MPLRVGVAELAGPYSVGFAGLVLTALLIFAGLRPDPRDIGRELASRYPEAALTQVTRHLLKIVRQPGLVVTMGCVFAQLVMMVPTSITSVRMTAHQHPLSAVSPVISSHTLGMFAFSILSGRMTDRWRRGLVIVLGSTLLILSCLLAAPSIHVLPLIATLLLLGLGWNLA